jgi:Hypothetical protein (DUF2513)
MKRDMELIRKMVLLIEDHPGGSAPSQLTVEGYDGEEVGDHAYLLVDSGLADGTSTSHLTSSSPQYRITRLTSAGHDFADRARNQYVWEEVMADIKAKGLTSVTLDILRKLLDKALRKKLEAE